MIEGYRGIPFVDERHTEGAQQIPGKIMCALYDLGGEGIAYHDTVRENQGSGKLNPANGEYRNEFRMYESVDISYIKPEFDHTDRNFARPDLDMFYVGWTEPGEWLNYTVNVCMTGSYQIDFLYSAAKEASVSLAVDGVNVTGEIVMKSTTHPHIWNRFTFMSQMKLEKGVHILTLRTEQGGLMNYAYLEFIRKTGKI